jgi:hypothetical protein
MCQEKGGTSMARTVTYECKQCGTEVVVTETQDTSLSPIYCCGVEVSEVSKVKKRPPAKKAVKNVKKVMKKETVAKKNKRGKEGVKKKNETSK